MKFDFIKDATKKPLAGYIYQSSRVEGNLVYYPRNGKIIAPEFLSPLPNKKLYYNSSSGNHEISVFIPGNEKYRLFLQVASADVTFTYTTLSGSSSETITTQQFGNYEISALEFQTPADTLYVDISIDSGTESLFGAIHKLGVVLNPEDKRTYFHISKYRAANINECKVIDETGTIYGYDKFSITEYYDGIVKVETDIDIDKPYYLHYTAMIESGETYPIIKEPINPVAYSDISGVIPKYGTNKNRPFLFLYDRENPIEYQSLGLREHTFISRQGMSINTYSISPTHTYLLMRNGRRYSRFSKVIKEKPTVIKSNQIKTMHPIRVPDHYPYTYDSARPNPNAEDIGINIYLDGILMDNNNIKYIHKELGIVQLKKEIRSAKVKVTYITDAFQDLGLIKDTFPERQNYQFYLAPNSNYLNIINGIDDPRLTDPSTNLNPEFSVTGSTYYDYYPAYIGRDSGDEILSDSFNMGSLDDISIIITYAGKVGIDGKEYDDTISYSSPTYNSGSVDTIATQTLHISTASTITKILITAAQDSTKIYDIQIFGVGSSDGSMYYTDDGLTLTDMYDGSTTLLSAITNAKLIGTLNIGKVRNEKIFNFVQINKRGGGLNEDDIIEQITGYDRYSQFPDSYDYADIARRDNMPFNPRKYIIVKLPISIIGELMTKEQRINAGIGSRELRQKIINRIYAIIRRDMPAGAYFKIYDYNNDPWPEENSL